MAGLHGVNQFDVENIDLTDLIWGHASYRRSFPAILSNVFSKFDGPAVPPVSLAKVSNSSLGAGLSRCASVPAFHPNVEDGERQSLPFHRGVLGPAPPQRTHLTRSEGNPNAKLFPIPRPPSPTADQHEDLEEVAEEQAEEVPRPDLSALVEEQLSQVTPADPPSPSPSKRSANRSMHTSLSSNSLASSVFSQSPQDERTLSSPFDAKAFDLNLALQPPISPLTMVRPMSPAVSLPPRDEKDRIVAPKPIRSSYPDRTFAMERAHSEGIPQCADFPSSHPPDRTPKPPDPSSSSSSSSSSLSSEQSMRKIASCSYLPLEEYAISSFW